MDKLTYRPKFHHYKHLTISLSEIINTAGSRKKVAPRYVDRMWLVCEKYFRRHTRCQIKNSTMPAIIFYDFDNTLSLWQLSPNAKLQYENQVKDVLQRLGNEGIFRVIVSTSTTLQTDIDILGFRPYVDYTIAVRNPFDKINLMLQILQERKISLSDAVYFDDDDDCVREARKHGIHSICVSRSQGILPHVQKSQVPASFFERSGNEQ